MSGFFTYTGTLERVNVSEDGKVINLIFPHLKWNNDLRREVEDSLSIMVGTQHLHFASEYKAHVGKVVSIPCRPMVSREKHVLWYTTAGDGKLITD